MAGRPGYGHNLRVIELNCINNWGVDNVSYYQDSRSLLYNKLHKAISQLRGQITNDVVGCAHVYRLKKINGGCLS